MAHRDLVAALILAAAALPASGATVNVAVGGAGLVFTPQTVHIQAGDTVTFTNAGGFHSVQADDGSFGNAAASPPWSLSHTYPAAGTFGVHCTVHGSPGSGMFGTVIVEGGGGGGGSQPGALGFSLAAYSVNEGAGTATIAVQRTGGDDGAVSVQYAATAGTATAGQDFNPTSGTLSWADKDDATKTFTVRVINDTAVESSETVLLALSNATGGATLDASRKNATLTIQDNDTGGGGGGGGGGPLATPTNLKAVAVSTGEIDLTWTDNSNNETGFAVERRGINTPYELVASVGPNTTSAAVLGLDPGSFSLFRVRATGSGSTFSSYSTEAASATLANPGTCVADANTLCVTNNRFKVQVEFRSGAGSGPAFTVPLPSAPASGLFYFFDPTNIEMLIKVLNACVPPFNHYWVYFAATTNVEFSTVVTDLQNGQTRAYFNPLNRQAVPVQDGNAFATCP